MSIPFVLALLFFFSLWFSWQIEAANQRNIVPLLPMWSIMVAFTGTFWNGLRHAR